MKFPLLPLSIAIVVTIFVQSSAGAQGSASVVRPPIVGVADILLRTDDLSATHRFYADLLGFPETFKIGVGPATARFKVNDHQSIQLFSELKEPRQDRLIRIAFETTDAEKLRLYLASQGVTVPDKLDPGLDGNLGFDIIDPDGHDVEFIQYFPPVRSSLVENLRPHVPISQRIIHVGFTVHDRAGEDHFYRDILGFKETWHGGMKDDQTDWVDMRVPDGTDWLEYMLNVHDPDPRVLGIMHHVALGVPDINAANQELIKRGFKGEQPKVGRDGKWQLNLYDPSLTRVELMEPKPVQKPCCSPMQQ